MTRDAKTAKQPVCGPFSVVLSSKSLNPILRQRDASWLGAVLSSGCGETLACMEDLSITLGAALQCSRGLPQRGGGGGGRR